MTKINSALASTIVKDYIMSNRDVNYTAILVTKESNTSPWYALIDKETGDALVPCGTCLRIYRKREYHL